MDRIGGGRGGEKESKRNGKGEGGRKEKLDANFLFPVAPVRQDISPPRMCDMVEKVEVFVLCSIPDVNHIHLATERTCKVVGRCLVLINTNRREIYLAVCSGPVSAT